MAEEKILSQGRIRFLCEEKKTVVASEQTKPKTIDHDDGNVELTQTVSESMRKFDQSVGVSFKYKKGAIFTEYPSGPNDLITPVHRYVYMETINSEDATIGQFAREIVKFACSCLNDRTNGTIHFGVRNGKVLGTTVPQEQQWPISKKLTGALKSSFCDDKSIRCLVVCAL